MLCKQCVDALVLRRVVVEPQAQQDIGIDSDQLGPLNRSRYGRPFTDAQWARLQSALPQGVCDYALPGVGQGGIAGTWLRY